MSPIPRERRFESHEVEDIEVRGGRRVINGDAVERLAQSMSKIGLKTPISVCYYMERPDFLPGESADAIVLIAGAHRLEAAKRLGWKTIECFAYYNCDLVEAELWEISENLHRAELTALERDEQVARWIALTKGKQGVFSQLEKKPQGGRPEGGINGAVRALGIDKNDAYRAVQVASLSPEAKEAARETGLADNRGVLLKAAKQEGSEAQIHYLRAEYQRREGQSSTPAADPSERDFHRLLKAWQAACPAAQKRFSIHIGADLSPRPNHASSA